METILENGFQNGSEKKHRQDYESLLAELQEKELFFEKKNWRDSIISNYDELLRLNYNKSIPEFAHNTIEYLAENSQACQGIFYIVKQESQSLKAIGGYACSIEQLPNNELPLGEGLAGQAASSKKVIFFDNIPAESIHLKSVGNMQFNLGSLLFLPLVFNEKVFGVIELLYLKDLVKDYRELLDVLAKNTAATLESILNNELTQKLLQETQEKESELQANNEEMLQNMEELKSIQEEMRKKQNETLNFVKAIDSSGIALIEFDLQGIILRANESFLQLMGYTSEEILGKPHQIFVEEGYADSEEYKTFWDNLRAGKRQKGEFVRRTKTNKKVHIFGAYSVMKDADGEAIKVIKLATDISESKQLLEQLEENNASLVSQEEELRQSLEELTTVQNNLEDKNFEMEHFYEAVNNSSFAMIEFDLKSNILNANEAFLELFGYELEEIKGQKHRIFVPEDHANSAEYANFWESLNKGLPQKGTFHRICKDQKPITIKGAYSIIKDKQGEVKKILKLATEV